MLQKGQNQIQKWNKDETRPPGLLCSSTLTCVRPRVCCFAMISQSPSSSATSFEVCLKWRGWALRGSWTHPGLKLVTTQLISEMFARASVGFIPLITQFAEAQMSHRMCCEVISGWTVGLKSSGLSYSYQHRAIIIPPAWSRSCDQRDRQCLQWLWLSLM